MEEPKHRQFSMKDESLVSFYPSILDKKLMKCQKN